MLNLHGKDIKEIHDEAMNILIWHPVRCVEGEKTTSIYSYDNVFRADSCDMRDFDLASVGFTTSRWTRFLGQYIDHDALEKWLCKIKEQGDNVINFFTPEVPTDFNPILNKPEEKGHRWGPCFLGFSFRKSPHPCLTLYSRTGRFPNTASLELAAISRVAHEIQTRYKITEPIEFTWYCSSIFVSVYDVVYYLQHHGWLNKFLKTSCVLSKNIARELRKVEGRECTKAAMPFVRQKRCIQRYREFLAGQFLKPVPVNELSIWKKRKRRNKKS